MKKNMVVPVAVAVAIIGCVLAVSANVTTSKIHKNLDQERYKRFAAEQELLKANSALQEVQGELTESRQKIEGIQKIVSDGNSANSNLKNQLDALNKEKEALRQQLQQTQSELANQAVTEPAQAD